MSYELFLALRYLKGLRKSHRFLSVIAAIAVGGVAVGVAALLVVLGVMSGFDADLEERIAGSNPHLIVEAQGGIQDAERLIGKILEDPHFIAAAPFSQTQVILRHQSDVQGVILRGVDSAREPEVTKIGQAIFQGKGALAPKTIFIGSELARRWGASEGEMVTIVGGKKGASYQMTIGGIFTTGMYDYDMHLAVASLETAAELSSGARISGVGIRVKEPMSADLLKGKLQKKLGFPFWVTSWMDLNKNLFAALALEKVAMFVILSLIVLVACFNIVATLLMMVVKKTREIGILQAVGATRSSIRRIFTWVGLLIGGTGTVAGSLGGMVLCGLLSRYQFIRLPPEIYYIDRLPVLLKWQDALSVAAAAMALAWAACLYPAWVASRLEPAEALRYE